MIRKRLRYYIIAYILGYIISLINGGVSNIYCLIPIKLLGIVMALTLGNTFYYVAEEKEIIFTATVRTIKYILLSMVLMLITFLLYKYLLKYHSIDILPFIGI